MPDTDKSVFISYRRAVSSFIARAIFMDLHSHGYDVFMDVESIDAGTFDTIILNQIAARAYFLVILTPGTLERCVEPGDWLRREIDHAIKLKRSVIPVLVNGFSFEGQEQYLIGLLAELPRFNAVLVYHEYFDEAMARLRERFLTRPATGPLQPTPPDQQATVQRKIEEAARQPAPTGEDLDAEERFTRGVERLEQWDYAGAIAILNEVVASYPRYAVAYLVRGAAHSNQGDYRRAVADFERFLDLDDGQHAVDRLEVAKMIQTLLEKGGG